MAPFYRAGERGSLPGAKQARVLHFRERLVRVFAPVLKRELGGFEPGPFGSPSLSRVEGALRSFPGVVKILGMEMLV